MTREELRRIVRYINFTIKEYIPTNISGINIAIQKGYFDEQEFIDNGIVELDNQL